VTYNPESRYRPALHAQVSTIAISQMNKKRVFVLLGSHGNGLGLVQKALVALGLRTDVGELSSSAPTTTRGDTNGANLAQVTNSLLTLSDKGAGLAGRNSDSSAPAVGPDTLWNEAVEALAAHLRHSDLIRFERMDTLELLSFWKALFRHMGYEVAYVLVVRNPRSVAASLAARDGMASATSHAIWLDYILKALTETDGETRVVVNYDDLVDVPAAQLARLARGLGLAVPSDAELEQYGAALCDKSLRHSTYTLEELERDTSIPAGVAAVYRVLHWMSETPFAHKADPGHTGEPGADVRNGSFAGLVRTPSLHAVFAELERDLTRTREELTSTQLLFAGSREQITDVLQRYAELQGNLARLHASRAWRIGTILAKSAPDGITALLAPAKIVSAVTRGALKKLKRKPRTEPGFDEAYYLQQNPDVAASGADPYEHYRLHGKAEGRIASPLKLDGIEQFQRFDKSRETVLVVSHEASLTGAPVLSLNITEVLATRYNVVVLLLGGGPLLEHFSGAGAAVVGPFPQLIKSPQIADSIIASIREQCPIKFAITNSIVSAGISAPLAWHSVVNVPLIHEFAAYTRPQGIFASVAIWAGLLVFSTRLTLESALQDNPALANCRHEVLPQGQCHVPVTGIPESDRKIEEEALADRIRGRSEKQQKIVLGLGTVQMRKGVELFIAVARRMMQRDPGTEYRFVWIGHGFRPSTDLEYSAYLADQIARSGLQGRLEIMAETPHLHVAYACSDILLLTSRLDPLPNVAIDAMSLGLPVVCFENTTGLADILTESGLGGRCVAEYLDIHDMADKAIVLVREDEPRASVRTALQELVRQKFDMRKYVECIEQLAAARHIEIESEKRDAACIEASGLLEKTFGLPPTLQRLTLAQAANLHIRCWATGLGKRKPFPAFHPGIYRARRTRDVEGDPFVHYVRAGRPDGPWLSEVITEASANRSIPSATRVALHIHVYYADLLPGILDALEGNTVRPDLYISVPSDRVLTMVAARLGQYLGKVAKIAVVPNRGRDIGPLLTAFGPQLCKGYDVIGHLHTKKTSDVVDSSVGETWHRFLLANLLGGQHAMADRIVARMVADDSVGIVFPADPNVPGWDKNREYGESLARRLGLSELPDEFNFPVGTMFWIKANVLAPFVDLKLDWKDYPAEPLPYDGSILHALERLFPLVAAHRGMREVLSRCGPANR
jgi:glycosyltransferase involved in cell wall biosynthesis